MRTLQDGRHDGWHHWANLALGVWHEPNAIHQTLVNSQYTDNAACVVVNIIILVCEILGNIFDCYVKFECLLVGAIAEILR